MKLDFKNSVEVHNRYELELRDTKTGVIKQTAHAENVVLNQMWTLFNATSGEISMFAGIAMGTGTGTPGASDTALFAQAFRYMSTMTRVSMTEAYPTSTYVYRLSIPADAAYVGNLTEIGLVGTRTLFSVSALWTHAILRDSENNPITINKTDLDELIITAHVHVTFGATDVNFKWYMPGPKNQVCRLFRVAAGAPPIFNPSNIKLCHCTTINTDDSGCITNIVSPSAVHLGTASMNYTTRTLTVPSVRMGTAVGNGTYYNGVVLGTDDGYFGGIVYPNSNIFPNQTISGMRVGVGDGSTVNFALPIESIVANTDIVKVNGTALTRGVDYTIDNNNMTLSAGDAMALSNFLEPVSGVEFDEGISTAGLPTYSNTYLPFSHYTDENVQARNCLKSSTPLIYKVSNSAPYTALNRIVINPLVVGTATHKTSGGTSNYYNTYAPGFYVYDGDPAPAITVYETALADETPGYYELVAFVNDVIAHPSKYTTHSTRGEVIAKARMGNDYHRVIQLSDDLTYYALARRSSSSPYVLMFATLGEAYPIDTTLTLCMNASGNTFSPEHYGISLTRTIAVGDQTWRCGYIEACTYSGFTYTAGAGFYGPSYAPNKFGYGDFLTGCHIKLSGGASSSGPWTILRDIDLGALDQLRESSEIYTYGKVVTPSTYEQTTYAYYKVELDTSEATNIDIADHDIVMFILNAISTSSGSLLSLGYVGSGITFTNAPAADAVITLDAAIDRPYKNSNFVIDAAMTLQF